MHVARPSRVWAKGCHERLRLSSPVSRGRLPDVPGRVPQVGNEARLPDQDWRSFAIVDRTVRTRGRLGDGGGEGLFGAGFLFLELKEFTELVAQHMGPANGAYYSGFFALVGCHGLHVTVGLLWLGTMMAQIWVKGFRPTIMRRMLCFNLFWHTLDIIWVAVFTVVYLLGALP